MARRNKSHSIFKIFIFIILIVIAFFVFKLYRKYSLSDERANLNNYFNINKGETAIIVDDKISDSKAFVKNKEIYLPVELVQSEISNRFYYAKELKELRYTLPKDIIHIKPDENTYTLESDGQTSKSLKYTGFKIKDKTAYINIKFVKDHAKMDFKYFNKPSRVQIHVKQSKFKVADITDDTEVRIKGGVKSPILSDVKEGTNVEVVEHGNPWTKIHTNDGFVGYVKDKYLDNEMDRRIKYKTKLPKYEVSNDKDDKVSLVWHQITAEAANEHLEEMIEDMDGVNTIAPTWMFVTSTSGSLASFASEEYVNIAHDNKLKVWGTVHDYPISSQVPGINSSKETLETLSNSESRDHLVQMIIKEATRVGLDGINIDFEKVNTDCTVHFVEFIRELSVYCRLNKLKLSIDNYPPTYSGHYNRKDQAEVADYIIVMAYDEYGSWSKEIGPCSTIKYVENAIKDTIADNVPSQKLVVAIPFFDRLWTVDSKDKISSSAMGMVEARELAEEKDAQIEFNKKDGQNIATWTDENKNQFTIWLEDVDSIKNKLKFVKTYKIAGAGFWRLGLEDSDVWDEIEKALD